MKNLDQRTIRPTIDASGLSFSDPFQSRSAPRWPERQDTQDMPAYVITPDRLEFIRGQKMYPFFDRGGNDGNGDFQVRI